MDRKGIEVTSLYNWTIKNLKKMRNSSKDEFARNVLTAVIMRYEGNSTIEISKFLLKTKSNFADLIKAFSDNNINTTIVIVGIADDISDLIGSHPSLERCLKQIKMPRMSDKESEEIILKGLSKLELTISDNIKNKIIE